MEVAGIDNIPQCSLCICALCERGSINPKGTNDCPHGKCSQCHTNGKSTRVEDCPDVRITRMQR